MKKLITFIFCVLMITLLSTVNAQTVETFEFEAETPDIWDPADIDTSWTIWDNETASGGQFIEVTKRRTYRYLGYNFTTTSTEDTVFWVWVRGRATSESLGRVSLYEGTFIGKTLVNWDVDEATVEAGGTAFPGQAQCFHNFINEVTNGDTLEWKWHLLALWSTGEPTPMELSPGEHTFYLRSRDAYHNIDKIFITNDLSWRPDIRMEFEAEDGNILSPMVAEEYEGASGGYVVTAPEGSPEVGQYDDKSRVTIEVQCAYAPDSLYVWIRVDFPSDTSNSYWIGNDQYFSPLWEGDITDGLEWQIVKDEVGEPAKYFYDPNAANFFIKQYKAGTKIDKVIFTNSPDSVNTSLKRFEQPGLVENFTLNQNYPNPFNPSTNINFNIPNTGEVKLVIYNILGQKVITLVNNKLQAGIYNFSWNGRDRFGSQVATGVYFYRMEYLNNSIKQTEVRKMMMMK